MSLFTSVYFITSMRKFIVNRWEIDCSRLITFNSFKFDVNSKLEFQNCHVIIVLITATKVLIAKCV